MADVRQLRSPKLQDWDWQLGAACRGMDSNTFYHPDNERGPSRRRREKAAKAVCNGCPVAAQCLTWALQTREPYGIWGGKNVEERDALIAVATASRTDEIPVRSAGPGLDKAAETSGNTEAQLSSADIETRTQLGDLATSFSDVQPPTQNEQTA